MSTSHLKIFIPLLLALTFLASTTRGAAVENDPIVEPVERIVRTSINCGGSVQLAYGWQRLVLDLKSDILMGEEFEPRDVAALAMFAEATADLLDGGFRFPAGKASNFLAENVRRLAAQLVTGAGMLKGEQGDAQALTSSESISTLKGALERLDASLFAKGYDHDVGRAIQELEPVVQKYTRIGLRENMGKPKRKDGFLSKFLRWR